MSPNSLGQFLSTTLKQYTGKKCGLNAVRGIWSSEVFKDTPQQKVLKQYAYRMGNSYTIQMEHYRKNVKKESTSNLNEKAKTIKQTIQIPGEGKIQNECKSQES
jgi:hypothetical protein